MHAYHVLTSYPQHLAPLIPQITPPSFSCRKQKKEKKKKNFEIPRFSAHHQKTFLAPKLGLHWIQMKYHYILAILCCLFFLGMFFCPHFDLTLGIGKIYSFFQIRLILVLFVIISPWLIHMYVLLPSWSIFCTLNAPLNESFRSTSSRDYLVFF